MTTHAVGGRAGELPENPVRRVDKPRIDCRGKVRFLDQAEEEAREDSDVDLPVDPSNQKFSIFDLVRLRDLCRTILGTTADIHDYDGLRCLPEFRRRVSGDLARVF